MDYNTLIRIKVHTVPFHVFPFNLESSTASKKGINTKAFKESLRQTTCFTLQNITITKTKEMV